MAKSAPGPSGRVPPPRYLDPVVLARIDNLDLVARTVMQGFVGGAHPTAKLGISTDFAEYRGYSPGDDVRFIDWRVYGRCDRLYMKSFEADSNADFVVAVDVSGSMDYTGAGISKFDYARLATASLIHLAARQRDRVGLAAYSDRLVEFIAPSARNRNRILELLPALEPKGPGDLHAAMTALSTRLRRKSIIVILSDLYETPEDVAKAFQLLRLQGHDVTVFQVLDPHERNFEIGDLTAVEDQETGEVMPIAPGRTRAAFKAAVQEHVENLRRECVRRDVDYDLLDTGTPLEELLFAYLSRRARRTRRK